MDAGVPARKLLAPLQSSAPERTISLGAKGGVRIGSFLSSRGIFHPTYAKGDAKMGCRNYRRSQPKSSMAKGLSGSKTGRERLKPRIATEQTAPISPARS